MRFDLERDCQAVTDVDNPGIFARTLQYSRPLGGQAPQVHT